MRCEIIAIGTELLLGQIVDTNSSWLGQELALAGIDSVHQSKVGDNLERIVDSIRLALGRSDAVILCGGLGPTQDDITREAIAEVMGVSLVRDHEIGEKIRELFTSRGREMTQNNLRQADRPEGASLIPEMPGTAPGLICPINNQVIYAVPGVPHEMRTMVKGTVISDLKHRAGFTSAIRSRVLRTWGRTESGLAEMLADRIRELDQLGTATLAFQASGIEGLKVRITVKAADEESANAVIADEEKRVRHILGDCVFGIDDETMESVVLDLLRERSMRLAVAESVTGGLVGARLAAVPMASEVLTGTMVAYSKDLAAKWFEMPPGPIVSREAVMAMANGVRQALNAEVGLAVTGVASPSESSELPVGTVFFGFAIGDQIDAVSAAMPGDRNRIREYSVINLLNFLRRELLFGDRKQYKK
ncbi:MAG TPA: competence/damage-inducible protein A [Alphaproteobacteria bacterium]|jgi:nicotinamide-nucleotide amidase|nr:competence/damage-inducible protein A [Alphaproteobacteria bacterium]|tara:strand:- start:177 stop:1433 length:1257 start_codon:yes stop_codon:yes gene_type:complete